jgi:hypothetical protein
MHAVTATNSSVYGVHDGRLAMRCHQENIDVLESGKKFDKPQAGQSQFARRPV